MSIDDLIGPLDVIATSGEALTDAASRMRFNDVGCVPVVDGGCIVGILTERDLTRASADGSDPRTTMVGDYMTPDPVLIGPRTEVGEAARIMVAAGVRHLPIVDGGKLRGVISMRDLIEALGSANGTQLEPTIATARDA